MKKLTTLLLVALLPLWGLGGFAQEKLSKEEKARREKNIQAGNPFARFGYKAKVATLSKGKYLEFHDLDSIVVIGTVRWHVNKNQIVGRITQDSLNPDAQPIGDRAGRWISTDPLSEEFPSWSPYNMCYNNPLKFVDPDGRAPDDDIFSKTGKFLKHVNNNSNNIYIESSKNKYTLLSRYQTNVDRAFYVGSDKNAGNRKMISNIATYFAKKAGINSSVNVSQATDKETLAFFDHKDNTLNLNNANGGKIDSSLNNSYSLMSVLGHEMNHKEDDKNGLVTTYTSHSQVYMNQILEDDFSKAPMSFQKGTVGSFANHIYNAQLNNESHIDDLITKFNKSNSDWKVGTEYKSGYGFPVYYKGKELSTPTSVLKSPSE